jgi:hypothetical protein
VLRTEHLPLSMRDAPGTGEGVSPMSLYDNPSHLKVVGSARVDFAKEYL